VEAGQGDLAVVAATTPNQAQFEGSVLLAGKIGRSLEGAAQGSHAKERGQSRRVSANALRTAQELDRSWWKNRADLGSR